MLNFRVLIGAIAIGFALIAGILFAVDDGEMPISTLRRPAVETAAIPRAEPVALPSKGIVIPGPVAPPKTATPPVLPDAETTGSTGALAGASADDAGPPPQRPRPAARKKESEQIILNPLELLFRHLDPARAK
jgi:hypothetical protein